MLPKLNRRRALSVLTKIDEILAWEKKNEAERDTRFVELSRHLRQSRRFAVLMGAAAGSSEAPSLSLDGCSSPVSIWLSAHLAVCKSFINKYFLASFCKKG
jgi:hypothetical protein